MITMIIMILITLVEIMIKKKYINNNIIEHYNNPVCLSLSGLILPTLAR